MADRNTGRSSTKKKEKTNSKPLEEKEKDKTKAVKKTQEKPAKKPEKSPKQPAKGEEGGVEEKKKAGDGEAVGVAEAKDQGDGGDFEPIELPPFEIVTGWVDLNQGVRANPTFLCPALPFSYPLLSSWLSYLF